MLLLMERLKYNKEVTNYMRIAIASEGANVSGHFGKCEYFTIVEIEDSGVKSKDIVNTKGHQHGLLPAFLVSHNVDVVIAGGMGEGARRNLTSNGIEIITGISSSIDEAIREYLNGNMKSSNTGCGGHNHSRDHGESGCSCGHHQ